MSYDIFSIIAWSMVNAKPFPRCNNCKVLYANHDKKVCTECFHDDEHRNQFKERMWAKW